MKIDRFIIIRRDSNQISKNYARLAAESIAQNHHDFEFLDAVENVSMADAAAACGMHLNEANAKSNKDSYVYRPEAQEMGNYCCTASHINAWRRILEIGKPCVVFEHDAVLLKNVGTLQIEPERLYHLGPRMRDLKTYTPKGRPNNVIQVPQAIGTHAYAIHPETAESMLREIKRDGFMFNIDTYLFINNLSKRPIFVADPPPASCFSRESTMDDHTQEDNRPRGVWLGRNDKNVPAQITPGLLEGLGFPVYN